MTNEWADQIDKWLRVQRAAGRPESTRKLRAYQLSRIATGVAPLGPWQVQGGDLVDFFGSQGWGRETRRSWRSAVRGFYGWAHDEGLVDVDPSRALLPVKPAEPNPRPTPEDEYRLALAGADDRVRLMVRIAGEGGLRRAEVAQIHARDLVRELDGWTLVVHGKGDKLRRVPVSDALAAAVRLRAAGGWLFPGNDHGHLSPRWVGKLVSRTLAEGWAMHSLRHRFGTLAYAHERDTFTVQELLGHASPVTTRRYVRLPADAMRRTVAAVAAAG